MIGGVTTANILNSAVETPWDREHLTSLVIERKKMPEHSLTKKWAIDPANTILYVISLLHFEFHQKEFVNGQIGWRSNRSEIVNAGKAVSVLDNFVTEKKSQKQLVRQF